MTLGETALSVLPALLWIAGGECCYVGEADDLPATTPGSLGDLWSEDPDAHRVAVVCPLLGIEYSLGDVVHHRLTALIVVLALRD
jgi:hypothetical protein